MKRFLFALVTCAALAHPSAWAANPVAGDKLAQDKQCLQCHAVQQDGAGPSFSHIAGQWKGKKGAEAHLIATIQRGSKATGGPHWGKATMPDMAERPLVSRDEARQLARWILAQ